MDLKEKRVHSEDVIVHLLKVKYMRNIHFNILWILEYLILVIQNFLNIAILAIIYLKLVIGIGRIYII